jgi:hypothetical protein
VSATALLRTNVLSYLAATGGGASGGGGAGGGGGGEALRVMVVLDFATYTVHPGGVSRAALAGLRALATGAKTPDGVDLVKVAVVPSESWGGRCMRMQGARHSAVAASTRSLALTRRS